MARQPLHVASWSLLLILVCFATLTIGDRTEMEDTRQQGYPMMHKYMALLDEHVGKFQDEVTELDVLGSNAEHEGQRFGEHVDWLDHMSNNFRSRLGEFRQAVGKEAKDELEKTRAIMKQGNDEHMKVLQGIDVHATDAQLLEEARPTTAGGGAARRVEMQSAGEMPGGSEHSAGEMPGGSELQSAGEMPGGQQDLHSAGEMPAGQQDLHSAGDMPGGQEDLHSAGDMPGGDASDSSLLQAHEVRATAGLTRQKNVTLHAAKHA